MVNPFTDHYKTFPDIDLVRIILKPEEYQAAAVEAAMAELMARNLPLQHVDELKHTIILQQAEKKQRRSNSGVERIKAYTGSKISNLNPFNREGVQQQIALIIFSSVFLLLFIVISNYEFLKFKINSFSFSAAEVFTLMPLLFFPIGLYYFHKRDRLGWVILSAWFIYSVLLTLTVLIRSPRNGQPEILPSFFPEPGFSNILLFMIINGSFIYALNRKMVRDAFMITGAFQLRTIIILSFLMLVIMFALGLF